MNIPNVLQESSVLFAIGGALLPPLMGTLQQSFGENALTTGTSVALCCLFVYYLYIILFSIRLSVYSPREESGQHRVIN